MSAAALQNRLRELSEAEGQIRPLINRLNSFNAPAGQADNTRRELTTEIHARLKDIEEELELLKDEASAFDTEVDIRRRGLDEEKEAEKERVALILEKLIMALKETRVSFRNAQLQAKKNAETARRKEREVLFSRAKTDGQKRPAEKLTQSDLEMNAAGDVTMALRRTHQIMQAELSRSQFAQKTLEQSTAAISSLSESYMNVDTLLTASRNLLGSLLHSQKSDTWYLETAFYIIVGTIIWLLFRRILYGPLWWLVWMPVRLIARVAMALFGIGITSKSALSGPPHATEIQETIAPILSYTATGYSAGSDAQSETPGGQQKSDRVIDQIAEMANIGGGQEGTNVDGISPEERERQEKLPRNPKKRMFEAEINKSEL